MINYQIDRREEMNLITESVSAGSDLDGEVGG